MASRLDDRWLWLGLGVFLFAASKGIAYGLQDVVTLSTISDVNISEVKKDQRLEESINIKTLWTLTKSPNPDIASSAASVLISRFTADPASTRAWSDDLFAADISVRLRAYRLLIHISEHCLEATLIVLLPASSVIGLLRFSLHDESRAGDTVRDAYHVALRLRDQGKEHAWTALLRLSTVVEDYRKDERERIGRGPSIHVILPSIPMNDKIVVHWCRAMRRMLQVRDHQSDALYQSSVAAIGRVEKGECSSLEDHGLASYGLRNLDEIDMRNAEVRLADDEPGDIGLPLMPRRHRTARFHEESPEETEVRRRRREAMVLHEGSGDVGRDDIIQRIRSP